MDQKYIIGASQNIFFANQTYTHTERTLPEALFTYCELLNIIQSKSRHTVVCISLKVLHTRVRDCVTPLDL